jgi:glycosyltransferase involved in cell wall biosynthesis
MILRTGKEASLAASRPNMPNAEPIRVLHIITRMIVGGAQENTLLSVEGLNRIGGYAVTLVSGTDKGPEGELLSRARKTIPLIVLPELYRSINVFDDFTALVKLKQIIRNGRYHIVHTHSSKAGVLGRLAAKIAGTPFIVHTLHSLVFHDYQSWAINRLWRVTKKACAPMTDHFISVSDIISEKAIAAGIDRAEKFTTIYSGMELDWFLKTPVNPEAIRREFGIPDDALVVGKIARLFPLKGHDQLLDAAPTVLQHHPNVRFFLVGDGILYDHLRQRAREMGILDKFVFAGLIDRERVPQMLAAMDVLVHTSLREGLARVLPQALAMGKPCVSFDIDGAPEVVIPGKTGYLVKAGDIAGLSDAISGLLSDPQLRARMGEEGRRLVDPAFRAETMVRQISDVYQQLIARYPDRIARFEAGFEKSNPTARRLGIGWRNLRPTRARGSFSSSTKNA